MKIDHRKVISGDKILFHTKGFSPVSYAIRKLTSSYWNHVGQIIREDGELYVIEALFGGVKKNPLEKYLWNNSYDLKVVRLKRDAFKDNAEYEQGIRISNTRMINKIGDKYDFFAIAFLGIKYVLHGYYKAIKNRLPKKYQNINWFQSRSKFFCSEAICLSDYNISTLYPYLYAGKTNQHCGLTTPKDIGKSIRVGYVTGRDVT